MAETIYRAAEPLLARALGDAPFRLIGVGIGALEPEGTSPAADRLFQDGTESQLRAEAASDRIRAKFGKDAIIRGRSLR
jgi:DNA polymerase-4